MLTSLKKIYRKVYQCWFRSSYIKMSNPNIIPLSLKYFLTWILSFSYHTVLILKFQLHRDPPLCSELPDAEVDRWQNTYRFPEQNRTFVLLSCDYQFSFTASPTTLNLIFHNQMCVPATWEVFSFWSTLSNIQQFLLLTSTFPTGTCQLVGSSLFMAPCHIVS